MTTANDTGTGYEWQVAAKGVRETRCDGCGLVRPVRRIKGRWLCRPCVEDGITGKEVTA
jgi:hypothetical protein